MDVFFYPVFKKMYSLHELIWWHNMENCDEIWENCKGPEILQNDTFLEKQVDQLCLDTKEKHLQNFLMQAKENHKYWDSVLNKFDDHNRIYEENCGEPVPNYKSKLRRFQQNVRWSKIVSYRIESRLNNLKLQYDIEL